MLTEIEIEALFFSEIFPFLQTRKKKNSAGMSLAEIYYSASESLASNC